MNLIDITDIEIGIVRNMMLSKSNRQIAEVLGWTMDDAKNIVTQLTLANNLTSFQEKLNAKRDARIATKPKKISKVKKAIIKKEKVIKEKRLQQKTERIGRNEYIMQRSWTMSRQPNFKTQKVDYSGMRTIRIDRKTCIYAKPGEDIEALKAKFLKTYKPVSE